MADLPRIFATPNIPFSGPLARTSPESFGGGVFHTIAQLADAMAVKQKPIDAAKASSEYDIQVNDAINALQANPDPNTWRQELMQKEKEIRATITAAYPDSEVQKVFNLHADRNYGNNVNKATSLQIAASHGKQLGDIEVLKNGLAQQIAMTDDPIQQETYRRTFNATVDTAAAPTVIQGRPTPASISPQRAEQLRFEFDKKIVTSRAEIELDANPSQFIKSLDTSKYAMFTPEEKRIYKGHANATIRQDIATQESQLRLDERKADSNIQIMIDQKRPIEDIQAKLEEYTAAGVFGGKERQQWKNRLVSGDVKDTPAQMQNATKLLADFKATYPTPNTIANARNLANTMRGDGRIGENGASTILGYLNQTQSHIGAEQRAIAAAGRAAAGGTKNAPNITLGTAKEIIGQNYPYDAPGRISSQHKKDIARFNDALAVNPKLDKGDLATKIRDDRARARQQQKATGAAVLTPAEKAAMDDLQRMRK